MLFVGLFVVLLCTYFLWWRSTSNHGHALPPAFSGELPIIGHLHNFLVTDTIKLWEIIQSAAMDSLKKGGVIYCKLGKLYYLITDPEDAVKVANVCLKKHSFYRIGRNWLGKGLITAPESVWYRHRKLLNPVFNASSVHSFLEVFNDQAKELIKDVEPYVGRTECDTVPHLRKFTLRTTCLTTFGRSELKGSSILDNFPDAIENTLKILTNRLKNIFMHSDFIYSLWLKKKEDKVVKTINELSDGVMQKYKETSTNGAVIAARSLDLCAVNGNRFAPYYMGPKHTGELWVYFCAYPFGEYRRDEKSYMSMLDHIFESPGRQSLTDIEIKDEINTIMLAGFETTSNALVYTLLLLGSYPEVQERLHEEVIQVLGADSDVGRYDLQKLVYTDAIVKESLRLLPAVVLIARYIHKDVELKNFTLRAGSDCALMLYGINRHSSWGPDAEQFKPERWLDPTSLPENSNAFAAFSLGKRSCIGKTYALASMKAVIVQFVRKYRWTADITKLKCKVEMTLQPVAGHEITLQHRK